MRPDIMAAVNIHQYLHSSRGDMSRIQANLPTAQWDELKLSGGNGMAVNYTQLDGQINHQNSWYAY